MVRGPPERGRGSRRRAPTGSWSLLVGDLEEKGGNEEVRRRVEGEVGGGDDGLEDGSNSGSDRDDVPPSLFAYSGLFPLSLFIGQNTGTELYLLYFWLVREPSPFS